MAEEKQDNSTTIAPTQDDLSVLRLLLHNIKGLNATSSRAAFVYEELLDESEA